MANSKTIAGFLVVLDPPEIAAKYPFYIGENIIGRADSKATLVIKQISISQRHARLYATNGRLTITDLGSKNGTKINTELNLIQSNKEIEIDDSMVIYFADVRCSIQLQKKKKQAVAVDEVAENQKEKEKEKEKKRIQMMRLFKDEQQENNIVNKKIGKDEFRKLNLENDFDIDEGFQNNTNKQVQVVVKKENGNKKKNNKNIQSNSLKAIVHQAQKQQKQIKDTSKILENQHKNKKKGGKKEVVPVIQPKEQALKTVNQSLKQDETKKGKEKVQKNKTAVNQSKKIQVIEQLPHQQNIVKNKVIVNQSKPKQNKKDLSAQKKKINTKQREDQNKKIEPKEVNVRKSKRLSNQKDQQKRKQQSEDKIKNKAKNKEPVSKDEKNIAKSKPKIDEKEVSAPKKINQTSKEKNNKKPQNKDKKIRFTRNQKEEYKSGDETNAQEDQTNTTKKKTNERKRQISKSLQNKIIQVTSRRSIIGKRVLFSGFFPILTRKYFAVIQDPLEQFDYLVMKQYIRTFKALIAICRGIPIVSYNWISDSEQYQKTMKYEYYLFKNHPQIYKAIQSVKSGELVFKGYQFFMLSKDYHLKFDQIQALIKAAGGTMIIAHTSSFVLKQKDMKNCVAIIRRSDNDVKGQFKDELKKAKTKGFEKIYTIQMLLDACEKQQINWEENIARQ